MTDTPPDWKLLELANLGGRRWIVLGIPQLQAQYINGDRDDIFRTLRDMIFKHEQPPVDRKLLCAREAYSIVSSKNPADWMEEIAIRAIELWEEGFGK